jgi:hypothetical protein
MTTPNGPGCYRRRATVRTAGHDETPARDDAGVSDTLECCVCQAAAGISSPERNQVRIVEPKRRPTVASRP